MRIQPNARGRQHIELDCDGFLCLILFFWRQKFRLENWVEANGHVRVWSCALIRVTQSVFACLAAALAAAKQNGREPRYAALCNFGSSWRVAEPRLYGLGRNQTAKPITRPKRGLALYSSCASPGLQRCHVCCCTRTSRCAPRSQARFVCRSKLDPSLSSTEAKKISDGIGEIGRPLT